jgi:hypothetical protein
MEATKNPKNYFSVFHPPSKKMFSVPHWYEEYNSWDDFLFFSKQKYPWKLSSTIRCKWMDTFFWVGVDTTVRVPTPRTLHFVAFAYELMDQPVWITFGVTRTEAISNMLWAISDTQKMKKKKTSAELEEFYAAHGTNSD